MSYKIQTVLGDIAPENLGFTLPHEHLSIDFSHFYREPPKLVASRFADKTLPRKNLGFVRQYPYSFEGNLYLNDAISDAIIDDVKFFKESGGGTIVENSTEGLDRNLNFVKAVTEQSAVHVVAGTGFYIGDMQHSSTQTKTIEELYNHMTKELTVGCDSNPDIKAGCIGEVASIWPLTEFERRVIVAAGEVQETVRCGVTFHPHRVQDAPFEIIRLYLEAGGHADKAVMSHLDRTFIDDSKLLEFADFGTYCQYDLFGIEVSYYQLNPETDMPSDAQRLNKIKLLVDEKKEHRILMSHDIHTKHRLIDFGGHGYAHILNNVLPRMRIKGFSQQTIDKITINNPAEWLQMKC